MSRSHNLAWAAGFIDGEGFITIGKRNMKRILQTGEEAVYVGHYLRLGVNHVDPKPINELYRLFGGSVQYDPNVKGNRKPRYRWIVNTSKAKDVLIQLLPYLINKQDVAVLGIEFQSRLDPKNSQRLSDEELAKRDWYQAEIQRINSED